MKKKINFVKKLKDMPYKDKDAWNARRRLEGKIKVETICCICGKPAFVRKDTLQKYERITCSKECKSILISQSNSSKLNEKDFIKEYLTYELGYETLCKKYKVGHLKGKQILLNNNIEIKSQEKIMQLLHKSNNNKLRKSEIHICKNCGKEYKFRKDKKSAGGYCSHECYMSYRGRTSIEEKISFILKELNIDFIEQYKVNRSYYDFYIPSLNILIEADGKYWHSLPKAIINDKRKDKLAIDKGYKLFRFTELEINQGCEDRIKRIINYDR